MSLVSILLGFQCWLVVAAAVAAWRWHGGSGGSMVAVTAVWRRWRQQLGCGSLAAAWWWWQLGGGSLKDLQHGSGGSSGVGGSVVAATAVRRQWRSAPLSPPFFL
jgi:hypothetical protein